MSGRADSNKPEHDVWPGGVLELAGRDAGAFAQAQLMNDVRVLVDGRWQWTGWLTPKGRVIALGALLRLTEDRYWLVLPDHPAASLADELRRFVFRSKVTLSARADLIARGSWQTSESATHDRLHFDGTTATLDLSGARARSLRLGPDSAPLPDAAGAVAWALEDLAHGLPRLREPATHTPQMLGLERLNAYSVKKGCYPGQEIVARTHFLGQAKRALQRLQCDVPLAAGDALQRDDRAIAEVLCSASDGMQHEALAVLAPDSDSLRTVNGEKVQRIDFLPGLTR